MFIEKVKLVDSLAYDFLLSLVRLNCSEMMLRAYDDQEYETWFEPDAEIIDWTKETARRLPADIRELLERFFNCETYFGVATFTLVQEGGLESPEQLIGEIKRTSEKGLLSLFLRTGFGPDIKDRNLPNLEKIVEKITLDEKEMLLFITKSTVFSASQKANLVELFSDPVSTKEDYVYLLEWYLENVFNPLKTKVKSSNSRQQKLLEKYITEDGESYLERLNLISIPDMVEKVDVIELGVSPFLGIDAASIMVDKKRFLFVLGYDRIQTPFRKKDERLQCIDVFEALASKERLEILRVLHEPYTPIALAKKVKISAGELNNHVEKLKKARLISSFLDGENVKYRADKTSIKAIVEKSLKRLLEDKQECD
mgnify:CR=1 FL=1